MKAPVRDTPGFRTLLVLPSPTKLARTHVNTKLDVCCGLDARSELCEARAAGVKPAEKSRLAAHVVPNTCESSIAWPC